MINVMNGHSMNLTAEYIVATREHPSDDVRVVVIHVNLDVLRRYFAAVVVDDVEGNVSSSSIVFEARRWLRPVQVLYGWGLESQPPSDIEGRRRHEHIGVENLYRSCSSSLITLS